jgi:uncharacterized protein
VVLIERGSEVGGGDVRTDVGTLARLVQGRQTDDGRWLLAAVGTHRIRIERWLPDDPYPRAEVAEWPDDLGPATGGGAGASAEAGAGADGPGERAAVEALLRRAAALVRELGRPAPPLDLQLADDETTASYEAVASAPLGAADSQRLLAAPTVADRWRLLHELLADQIELLQAQLGS